MIETFCWRHGLGTCWTCPSYYYPDLSVPSLSPYVEALRSVSRFMRREGLR